ncbi:MAG: S6e family ribosomal protein [Candidatus Bathyarchaeota archaeon]|jgi:small subunit ribosomal protein S6e|nr:S6e family ribosomal protein [Candidatus Bathyarchaeota archaeon]
MPVLIIANPEAGTNEKVELEDARMPPLVGLRIGETIDGTIADLTDYILQLTGGTDKDGIPMRPDVHGGVKVRVVLSGGVGFKPKNKGERKRVVVRGNTVTAETTFLNFKMVKKPQVQKK